MEITVCRETARAAASSACDSPRWVRRSRTRFCTMSRYLYLASNAEEASLINGRRGALARRLSGRRATAGDAWTALGQHHAEAADEGIGRVRQHDQAEDAEETGERVAPPGGVRAVDPGFGHAQRGDAAAERHHPEGG